MPLTKLTINGENVSFDKALELAKAGGTDLPFPFIKAIVASITNRQAVVDETQVSVTDVIGCPRAKYLKTYEEYAERPEDMMAAFRGTLLHQLLAKYAEEEAIVETRTSRDFGGHTLYGTADSIITTRVNGKYKLRDYKSTKRIPQYGPWTNHVQQLNLYRYLYELPVKETEMSVIYFDLNGAEVAERAVKARDYWSDTKVEEFLQKRFVPLAEAIRDKQLPQYRDVPADILSWMCSYCVDPDTPVLTSSLMWIPAGLIEVGHELLSVDEHPTSGPNRMYRRSYVEGVELRTVPKLKVVTDRGQIVVSDKHRFLVHHDKPRGNWLWVSADELVKGDSIVRVTTVWEKDVSWETGYLSAFADGEGCLSIMQNGMLLQLAQNPGLTLDRVLEMLRLRGYNFTTDSHRTRSTVRVRLSHQSDILRFLGDIRPQRLFDKWQAKFYDAKALPKHGNGQSNLMDTVKLVEYAGVGDVVAIQTSTSTLITSGLVSHNCPVFESCYNKLLSEPGALPIFAQATRERGKK